MTTASRNGKMIELERVTFEQSRSMEYFDVHELQTMTGQPSRQFAAVATKEPMDNALDAAEKAGVVPEIYLHVQLVGENLHISVRDNGVGMDEETVQKTINFATRTSDKAHYRAPTRGVQGNAAKTLYGIPHALGCRKPIVIESQGKRHYLRPKIDMSGEASIQLTTIEVPARPGTRFLLAVPAASCPGYNPHFWARAFSLFNPHALVKIRIDAEEGTPASLLPLRSGRFYYPPTVRTADGWKKVMPTDPTSPHWYDFKSLGKLIFGHINLAKKGDESKDLTLREFVMQFKGLSGSVKAGQICRALPQIKRLTDFEGNEALVETLLKAMQHEARVVKADALGHVGEEHFYRRFDQWFGVVENRFWYKKVETEIDNVPYVFEVAVAETSKPGRYFHGLNFSPSFQDPFSDTHLLWETINAYGAASFLYMHPVTLSDPVE
jgi:hypothetical protein